MTKPLTRAQLLAALVVERFSPLPERPADDPATVRRRRKELLEADLEHDKRVRERSE